jgi:hypothetical protein
MKIKYGNGKTKYGPGVSIKLSGDELAEAVDLYLYAKNVYVLGPRTIRYKEKLLEDDCHVYVDPAGKVVTRRKEWLGQGPDQKKK